MFITLVLTALFGGLFTAFKPGYGARFISAMSSGLILALAGSCIAILSPEKKQSSIYDIANLVVTIYACVVVLTMTIEINARSRQEYEQSPKPYPVTALAGGGQAEAAVVDDGYRLVDPEATTITITTIDSGALELFRSTCERALAYGYTRFCIELNTSGGYTSDAYAMADIIRELSKTVDVYIRVIGHCMSAGNIILVSVPIGKRISSANTQFMLHAAYGLDKHTVKESNVKLAKLLASGTLLREASLTHLFNSKQDCYLTAEEALARGLVGAIR
jgi:ATP-dependent protease ClpP protease subunit